MYSAGVHLPVHQAAPLLHHLQAGRHTSLHHQPIHTTQETRKKAFGMQSYHLQFIQKKYEHKMQPVNVYYLLATFIKIFKMMEIIFLCANIFPMHLSGVYSCSFMIMPIQL